MRYLVLLMAVTTSLLAEAPACLSGPVTKGSVTVSCIDVNPVQYMVGASAVAADMGGSSDATRLFVVRVQTTDPNTAGIRIILATSDSVTVDGVSRPVTQTGAVAIPDGAVAPVSLTYVFRMPWIGTGGVPLQVTAVSVEELRSAGRQAF